MEDILQHSEVRAVVWPHLEDTLRRRATEWSAELDGGCDGPSPLQLATDMGGRTEILCVETARMVKLSEMHLGTGQEQTPSDAALWKRPDAAEAIRALFASQDIEEVANDETNTFSPAIDHGETESRSAEDEWVEEALRVVFDDGGQILLPLDDYVNVIGRSAEGIKVGPRYSRSLRVGDEILLVHGEHRHGVYDLLVTRVHSHTTIVPWLQLVDRWHQDLRRAFIDAKRRSGVTFEGLLIALRRQGSAITTSVSVRGWVLGFTLAPSDWQDIRRLGEVLNIQVAKQYPREIGNAAGQLAGLHRSLSNRLNRWLESEDAGTAVLSRAQAVVDADLGLTIDDFKHSLVRGKGRVSLTDARPVLAITHRASKKGGVMTMSAADLQAEEVELARYLAGRVCGGAAGRLHDECTHNPPRDTYFIGSLRPAPPAGPAGRVQRLPDEVLRKIAPSAFGLDARLVPQGEHLELNVTLSWSSYHRLHPARAEQTAHQGVTTTGGSSVAPGGRGRAQRRDDNGGLFPRYRKIVCSASGRVTLNRTAAGWANDTTDLQHAVESEIARACAEIGQVPRRLRWSGMQQRGISPDALASDEAYERFWNNHSELPAPAWAWEISAAVRSGDVETDIVLELEAINRSAIDQDDWRFEGFFFDVALRIVAAPGILRPFELDLIPRGFRYDRHMWGRGFNCGVVREVDSAGVEALSTTNVPLFEQPRFVTSTEPPATFDSLARDPMGVLSSISAAMHAYDDEWTRMEAEYRARISDWDTRYGREYSEDRQKFRDEMGRFDRGLGTYVPTRMSSLRSG